MLIQEVFTDLPAKEVLERARAFFTLQFSPYAGWLAEQSENHVEFRFEAGSLTIAVNPAGERNRVRGSTTRLHHELSQFLTTLAPPEEVRQNPPIPGSTGAG